MYEASQELIDILLSYGFKEFTPSSRPEHWNRLQEKGSYSPHSVKRDMRFGRLTIFFDYINICIKYNSTAYYKTTYKLSETELKSIILFTKLTPSDRAYLKRHNINPTDIADYIEKYTQSDLLSLPSSSRDKIRYLQEALKKIHTKI